jgi:hypothetical protein
MDSSPFQLIDHSPSWERSADESEEAWEAFVLYRDMGVERSIRLVAQQLGKSEGLLQGWSSKHEWVRRAAYWDNEQDRVRREAQLEEIAEMSRRQATQAQAGQTVMMQPFLALIEKIRSQQLDLSAMGQDDLYALALQASLGYRRMVEIERLARGEPTDIISSEVSVQHRVIQERLELAAQIRDNPAARTAVYRLLEALGHEAAPAIGPGRDVSADAGDVREPDDAADVDGSSPPPDS